MELSGFHYVLVFVVTFFVQILDAVVGGGGFILQPFLMALGVPPHIAVAVDVTAAGGTSMSSAAIYQRRGLVRWKIFRPMLIPLLAGGLAGLFLLHKASPDVIEKFIAISAVLFLCYSMLAKGDIGLTEQPLPRRFSLLIGCFGFLLGTYCTFSGAGVGVFAPYILTTLFGLTFLQALGLQSVAFLVVMILGVAGYASLGFIDLRLLCVMAAAAILAGIFGAQAAIRVGDLWLRRVRAVAVLALVVYLLAK